MGNTLLVSARPCGFHTLVPLQRRVLLNVLAVLVESGGTDALQLSACKRGLEDVGRVNGALSSSSANQGVDLVNHLHTTWSTSIQHYQLPVSPIPLNLLIPIFTPG